MERIAEKASDNVLQSGNVATCDNRPPAAYTAQSISLCREKPGCEASLRQAEKNGPLPDLLIAE